MKLTPTQIQEITETAEELMMTLTPLYDRWQDEKEYEDFAEYRDMMKSKMVPGTTFGRLKNKPFRLIYKQGEWDIELTITSTRWYWKITH